MRNCLILLLATMPLVACGTVPEILRDAPADSPQLAQVLADPDAYAGRRVLWGGTVAGTENRAERTVVAVVERSLDDRGRPFDNDRSAGRFLVTVDRFLDPAIYTSGREVTVVGVLRGVESGQVGERRLALPLVQADKLQLWQPRPLYVPAPDPWYRPYPFGFYPPGYLHPYDYYDPFWWPYPYRGPQLYRPLAPDKLP